MTGTITALVGCQITECASEVSYHLDRVRMFNGKPICEECYEGEVWFDLPEITLGDLKT